MDGDIFLPRIERSTLLLAYQKRRLSAMSESFLCTIPTSAAMERAHYREIREALMTLEEALKVVQQTRSFVGKIYAHEVVLDGKFKPHELEAVLFVMRNRPAPPYETSG
jgi:hypothetical protein